MCYLGDALSFRLLCIVSLCLFVPACLSLSCLSLLSLPSLSLFVCLSFFFSVCLPLSFSHTLTLITLCARVCIRRGGSVKSRKNCLCNIFLIPDQIILNLPDS